MLSYIGCFCYNSSKLRKQVSDLTSCAMGSEVAIIGSSHRRSSIKKRIPKSSDTLKPATLLKTRPWHICSPVNFAKFFITHFLKNTSRRPFCIASFISLSLKHIGAELSVFGHFVGLALKGLKPRSSRPEVFCKKGVLRNFAKFTRKHLCQGLFFNKVASLRLWHKCFPVNFAKFLRTPFLTEHLRWLLLKILIAH